MSEKEQEKNLRYQLRHAAGLYWILDMWQEGVPYRKPLAVNEIGADIWRMLENGRSDAEIADIISRKYHADRERIGQDVLQFREKLQECGIYIHNRSK